MKTIYKYSLETTDSQVLELPAGTQILSVTEQFNKIVVYALVYTEEQEKDNYHFIIHGTGHPADDIASYDFLGTVKLENGKLVFHVFYKLL